MASVGIRLDRHVRKGLLQFHAVRPTSAGLEGHLAAMQKLLNETQPAALVVDPMTSILSEGNLHATKLMFTRLIDFLKVGQVTSIFTDLTHGSSAVEHAYEGVSSLMDAWIVLGSERRNSDGSVRTLSVVKSRGMAHSRGVRELLVKNGKIRLGAL
jgi:circadian clock protein KaiC